jgi:hypothetical protein
MATRKHQITAYRELWALIDARIVPPTSPEEQTLIRAEGLDRAYRDCEELEELEDAESYVAAIVRLIENVRRYIGYQHTATKTLGTRDDSPSDDPRWALLGELYGPGWAPISYEPLLELSDSGIPGRQAVLVRIDHRVSVRSVVTSLKKQWPKLTAAGIVRRTRRMGERPIALLRFVCVQSKQDQSWRERWLAWNRKYSRKGEWKFENLRAFHTAFQTAEKRLTGIPNGLRWYYSSTPREGMSRMLNRAAGGDRNVAREARNTGGWMHKEIGRKGYKRTPRELEDGQEDSAWPANGRTAKAQSTSEWTGGGARRSAPRPVVAKRTTAARAKK